MIDGVGVQLREATESSVRVTLAASGDVNLSGDWELYGPRCEYGRTLASTFRGRATEAGGVEFRQKRVELGQLPKAIEAHGVEPFEDVPIVAMLRQPAMFCNKPLDVFEAGDNPLL